VPPGHHCAPFTILLSWGLDARRYSSTVIDALTHGVRESKRFPIFGCPFLAEVSDVGSSAATFPRNVARNTLKETLYPLPGKR